MGDCRWSSFLLIATDMPVEPLLLNGRVLKIRSRAWRPVVRAPWTCGPSRMDAGYSGENGTSTQLAAAAADVARCSCYIAADAEAPRNGTLGRKAPVENTAQRQLRSTASAQRKRSSPYTRDCICISLYPSSLFLSLSFSHLDSLTGKPLQNYTGL